MQYPKLAASRSHRLICTWVHLSTPHTTRIFTESGIWDYMFYSNKLLVIINLWRLDQYDRKQAEISINGRIDEYTDGHK